jgi:four helix bundle protein
MSELEGNSRKKLRSSGGYRKTASFQTTTLIYDATVWFCEKFMDPRSRTVDQMVQAARSGRQNIAEGSRASATSSQTELRLVNVARASLEELLLDYEDYLRHRRLVQWAMDGPEASAVRGVVWAFKRDRADLAEQTDLSPPGCPQCGGLMALRTAKAGKGAGSQFWGCTGYPACKGTCAV